MKYVIGCALAFFGFIAYCVLYDQYAFRNADFLVDQSPLFLKKRNIVYISTDSIHGNLFNGGGLYLTGVDKKKHKLVLYLEVVNNKIMIREQHRILIKKGDQ